MQYSSKSLRVNRRRFLATSGAAAGVAMPLAITEAARGANDRVGVGFIGTGGRSGAHQGIINSLKAQGLAQPVAVCDPCFAPVPFVAKYIATGCG